MSSIPQTTSLKQDPGIDSEPRGTLLLVDDEENILSSLRRLLRQDRYQILTANGGESALALLDIHAVDVIVSDQRMPGMIGTEFLRRVRERFPDTIRIVLSGYTELESVTSAINDGAVYKFLTKPWVDEHLRTNISEAFRRKRLDDENRRLHADLGRANAQLASLLDERDRDLLMGMTVLDFSREMIGVLPCPVIGIDSENLAVFVNEAAERMIGKSILGMPILSAIPGDWVTVLQRNADAESQVQIDGTEYRMICKQLNSNSHVRGRVLTFLEVVK